MSHQLATIVTMQFRTQNVGQPWNPISRRAHGNIARAGGGIRTPDQLFTKQPLYP